MLLYYSLKCIAAYIYTHICVYAFFPELSLGLSPSEKMDLGIKTSLYSYPLFYLFLALCHFILLIFLASHPVLNSVCSALRSSPCDIHFYNSFEFSLQPYFWPQHMIFTFFFLFQWYLSLTSIAVIHLLSYF